MKNTKAKEIARDILQDAIAVAYYQLEEKEYTKEEKELISKYIH